MSRRAATLLSGWALLWQLAACDERRPVADGAAPGDVARADVDVTEDRPDARPDARPDVSRDAPGDRSDVPRDATGFEDTSPMLFRDRPPPMDGPVEGVDATTPDEGAVAFDVDDGCTTPRLGGVYDAGELCTPGRSRPCACSGGRRGASLCEDTERWGYCVCASVDAGITVQDGQVLVPERPIPWIGRPRLLAPQSGMRVTSQRPTLRWMLPSGIERARVELCADRPCARMLAQQELRGDRWRPTAALAAGVVFWRVRGLDEAGAVRWTSATWEFGVRHRDLGVDTSYGALKDFNGDGYDDLVTTESSDAILVYPGSARGIEAGRVFRLSDPEPSDFLPSYVVRHTALGDFNGDGLVDLAFGARFGRSYVHFGSRTCTLVRSGGFYRSASYFSASEDERSALSAGDFNGDGYADFFSISARMQLHLGGPSGPTETPADVSELTSHFAAFVGDLNGDGYQDILSMPISPGGTTPNLPLLVLYGNPEGRLDFHIERILDPRIGDFWRGNRTYVGYRLRWSDLNEDGYADAVVSVPGDVYVYYGSPAGYTRIIRPETPEFSLGGGLGGNFGGYTAHPADLDGDGHAEVVIGNILAPANEDTRENGPGRMYVFARDATAGLLNPVPMLTLAGLPGPVNFGKVAIPGDLNGDGYDDLVVGSASRSQSNPMAFLHVYAGGQPTWWQNPVSTLERDRSFDRSE